MRTPAPLLNITLALLSFFGFFTIHVWIGMLLEWSFNDLINTLFIPIVSSSIYIIYLYKTSLHWHVVTESNTRGLISKTPLLPLIPRKLIITIGLICLVSSLIPIVLKIDELFIISWFLLVLGITFLYWGKGYFKRILVTSSNAIDNEQTAPLSFSNAVEVFKLSLLGCSLVILYLFSLKTNADDSHFVSYIVSLLSYPDEVMFSKDVIFNQGKDNLIFALNYGQSWEALSAVISQIFTINHLSLYYIYLPSLFLFFTPVPLYYFTKTYFPKFAFSSTVFAFIILITWSTYNHLHGYFFIPRFYQGKAILISFLLPLLMLLARRFFINPNVKFGTLCLLVLLASAGATSTGIYISIVAFGFCFLTFTSLNYTKMLRNILLSILIITPNVAMLAIVKSEMSTVGSQRSELVTEYQQLNIPKYTIYDEEIKKLARPTQSMYWLFGDNKYLAMFLLLFIASILMIAYAKKHELKRNELMRLYLILGILGFAHPIATFLSYAIGPGNLVWRYHWALPMSIIFSLFAANILNVNLTRLISTSKQSTLKIASAAPILLVIAISLFFITLSANHLQKIIGNKPLFYKINQEAYAVALDIVQKEKIGDKILAANHVAEILPMLVRTSQLVTSRPLYWRLPYFSAEDLNKRKRLQYLINNMSNWATEDALFINLEIKQRNITTLAFSINRIDVEAEIYARVLSQFSCITHNSLWVVCQLKN